MQWKQRDLKLLIKTLAFALVTPFLNFTQPIFSKEVKEEAVGEKIY